ncbi:PREDICTED: uncharacterized protein LOC101375189 [Odobenus rosmarus divergens]|uniref:Uncharacterized protein LOC101375189 n=1 Tax=Odobenus rosmarus divergens TaxID=9708 RepID=A0A9B0GUN0_ODORO
MAQARQPASLRQRGSLLLRKARASGVTDHCGGSTAAVAAADLASWCLLAPQPEEALAGGSPFCLSSGGFQIQGTDGCRSDWSCPLPPTHDRCSQAVRLSMVTAPSDDSPGPQGTSNRLSPTEEEELGVAHPDRAILEESLNDRLLWEEALLGKIRTMSVLQKNVVLDTIHHCIKEHSQVGLCETCSPLQDIPLRHFRAHWGPHAPWLPLASASLKPLTSWDVWQKLIWKEVANTGIQELLAPLNLELKQPLEKTFLFHIYGLILRESANEELVRRHLADLLELSHQSANQREGIATAIGIVSSSHLPAVWAVLEHLGRTRFLRTAFMSPDCQQLDPDRHWRWLSCTSLLCYGRMALHAREQILPWVDNIISRMVYYFSCSCYDNILKTSFLSAVIMLMKALKQENSTQSYKFSQIPELIQCLLCILQKEPNFLATLFRQKIILVIVGLSKLRPSLKPMVKSRILQTCLQSLFMLPPMEKLKSCLPSLDSAPDVMVLYKKSMQALDLLLQNFISENKSMDEMCFLLQGATDSGMVCGLLASLCCPPRLLQPPRQLRPTQGFLDHTVPDLASPGGAGLVAGHKSLNHLVGGTGYGHLTVTQPQRPRPSQHMEPWLQSDKSHERKRVVQTIFPLLKYVVDYVTLTEEATPSLLGHQIGLLALLWRDKDPVTRSHSHQCIYLLLQLLIQQKGSMEQFMHLNKMKNFEAKARRESEMKFYNLVKALNRSLTVAQHTQLILALLGGLCSHSRLQCDLASQLLLMIFEDRSIKAEQVAEILQGLFQELPSVVFKSILQTMMKVVTVLGTQYTEETVEVILSLCHPSERSWNQGRGSPELFQAEGLRRRLLQSQEGGFQHGSVPQTQIALKSQTAGGPKGDMPNAVPLCPVQLFVGRQRGHPAVLWVTSHRPLYPVGPASWQEWAPCLPRQVLPLWKALASNTQLARKVLTLLYVKLKLRPPKELIRLSQQAELISLLALGTIYELLYTREYKATVHWAFAGILVGLLTQLHYLFELDAVEGISDYQEDILEMKPLSPCRTCLEALKGLFWTTNYWEVFAYLKLLRGWELFEHLETYTEGVTLLARAMAHYDCEVKAVLGQAVISLKSSEERDNIVAILIITEFLNSQELTQYISRRTMDKFLSLGLNNPNQLVRAMSLKGLSSILMHPKKTFQNMSTPHSAGRGLGLRPLLRAPGRRRGQGAAASDTARAAEVVLLRNRLAGLLDGFVKPEPKDLLGLMEILGDILHHLGTQGVGATSLKMAEHLLPLFEDEQAQVRGRAISLFGDVIYSGGKKYRQVLKSYAFQALVPLLFHLVDSCPKVVTNTKLTFLRCAILLKWEFRKELFGKLAWGHGLGAENDIFIYMVESNFGSYHQFLMQALIYLASPHKNLKHTAMKFIGGILQEYFTDLCFSLKKGDLKILRKYVEVLKQDPDSVSRRFYHSFLEDISELSQFVRH